MWGPTVYDTGCHRPSVVCHKSMMHSCMANNHKLPLSVANTLSQCFAWVRVVSFFFKVFCYRAALSSVLSCLCLGGTWSIGYLRLLCFISSVQYRSYVSIATARAELHRLFCMYRAMSHRLGSQHTIFLLNDCCSCHDPITRKRQSQRRILYLCSLVDVFIILFGVAICRSDFLACTANREKWRVARQQSPWGSMSFSFVLAGALTSA